ncbi:hypothetical protein Tco_0056554 [Tanacetum coccineum]
MKAQLQAKDTTIKKLKAQIKCVTKTSTSESVKNDIDEIATINIEREHKVAKLISENEHLKQTYKQLYDLIKPSHVRAKEYSESLVNQLNQKSVEITDLNTQLQEKVFAVTVLKNELRKLKGKAIIDNVVSKHTLSIIAPCMFKIDLEPLAPKLLNNREAHSKYLTYTQEQVTCLREIVEKGRSLNLINNSLEYACKCVKRIQELLIIIRQTCPSINNSCDKLIAVTPMNKDKKVRFTVPIPSSSNILK